MGYNPAARAGAAILKGSMMSILTTSRTCLAATGLLAALGLGACTTVEGTNALTDVATFEREVATETLKGLGVVPRESKKPVETPRAPLALPKDQDRLPQPQESRVASLPEDSDKVQIDASNLSEEDIRRLRNARVMDVRTLSGRPLTDAESRQLRARMERARLEARPGNVEKPLYLPPDEYFTTVNGQDTVCLAENGDLVPLDDPACPPEIKAALQSQQDQ